MKRFATLLMLVGLVGCDTGDRDNKKALGTLLGMGAGGVIGWFSAGGGFGTKLLVSSTLAAGGAVGGYYLSDYLLPQDREKLDSTAFKALNEGPTGETVAWGEEGKGAWGTFTPTRDFTGKDGRECRDYVATIHVGEDIGRIEEAACRIDDGGWQTVAL